MRRVMILSASVLIGSVLLNSAAFAAEQIPLQNRVHVAQSSAVTNCMMGCNSQAANCQTACVIPGAPSIAGATTTGNATASTSCQLNCTTLQLACQTTCAQNSPSQ